MRYQNGLLLLLTAASSVSAQLIKCNADNCLRGIRASQITTRSGSADCASYLRTVITPVTSISLVVVTPTTTRTVAGVVTTVAVSAIEAEESPTTFTPSAIPSYASLCSGSVRYSSACLCMEATPQVTVDATPTTTFTLTETSLQPTTPDPTATATVVKFLIQLKNGVTPGAYLKAVPWEVNRDFVLVLPTYNANDATVFLLDQYGKLTSTTGTPRTGLGDSGIYGDYVSFNDPDGRYPFFLFCAINEFNILNCRGGPYEQFKMATGPSGWYITPKGAPANALVMKAVPPPS
ncbi:hypothetical protein TWF730_005827 [Orbilia blumenaviensis]|uniref:Uncharacterized protein n=1 Tax=Orbilia blumenaviensis TaxID=1796055 RepID=A0AAV9VJI6_9PEZI